MKGKIVIVDASTSIGLSRIGQLSLLKKLFGEIIIPRGVYDEVAVERKERSHVFKKSTYLIIKDVEDRVSTDFLMASFGKGEAVKTPLFIQDYNDVFTFVENDLKANWEIYKERFLKEANLWERK